MAAIRRRGVLGCGSWELDLGRLELRREGAAVPLAARALEILACLAETPGELVDKDALILRVWPATMIDENLLQVHVSAIRKALGPDRVLLKTVFGRGYVLLGNWQVRSDNGPDAVLAPPPAIPGNESLPANLPVAATELIGRSADVAYLCDSLSAHRLVTLTGPGGIGKTTLALDVARKLSLKFHGQVWLVEFGLISDAGLVAQVVAHAIGLRLGSATISPDSVARGIGVQTLLAVLDNCEHVLGAVAGLVDALVRLCPNVSLLATSRETLRIAGEHVYRVPPLDLPPAHPADPDALLAKSAAKLFVARMQLLHADFSHDGESLRAIAAICRRLDGIPLAIEFAAARAAALGLRHVASRLDHRFEILTVGRRTALPRHRTLRAALDWSYELLSGDEQRLLRCLAVFPGGFTLDAVAAVSGAADVADAVASLVAKSLVNPDPQEPADRWRLLETIRAFALEKLAASGETESAARRHAGFYHDLLVRLAPALVLEPTTEGFRRCCRELENIRTALDWSFGPGANASLGTVLVAEYSPVWLHLSLIGECLERTEQALACLPADIDARLQMQLQIGLAYALIHTGGSAARTKMLLAMALETAIPLDEIVAQNYVFWASWICDANSGDFRAAARSAGRFSRLANRSRSPARRLVADRLLGATMHYRGDQRTARKYLKGLLDRDRLVDGQPYAIWFQYDIDVMARATLARVLCLEGFPDRAGENVAASLDGARAADHRLMLCHVLSEAACPVALITGDLRAAERLVEELIALATSHDAAYWKILGRCLEGQIHIARGAFTSGVALLRAALAGCDQSGWTVRYPEFLGALATGLAGMEHYADALACLDRAMQLADATGERWYMAELLRSKGELLRRDGAARSIEEAEKCFIGAIEVAQRQGALLWELRAGLALARLWEAEGRPEEARQIVTPISSRFTEGFESAELRAAAAMANR